MLEQEDDPFGGAKCQYIRSVEASKRLNFLTEPAIIISASGMCEAGRILHHLANNCENPKNTRLLVGYQAEGTLGRRIADGEPEIKIFGDLYTLKAEVVKLDTFSAHADENDLVNFVAAINPKPQKIFLVHGEQTAREKLREVLARKLRIEAILPASGQKFELQ
jgi:metallo-beta-lactamase family protein